MMRILALVVLWVSSGHSEKYTCETNQACALSDGEFKFCQGDCGCGDSIADECGTINPTTLIHVDSIDDCMSECEGFPGMESHCKFIIYHYDKVDENCIMVSEEFDSYIETCNVKGQALWGPTAGSGLQRWSNCKNANECSNDITGTCTSCQDCKEDPCSGLMLSQCNIDSIPLELDVGGPWSQCEQFGRIVPYGTVTVYNQEQTRCEVYGGIYDEDNSVYEGFARHCQVAIVKVGTDLTTCGGKR